MTLKEIFQKLSKKFYALVPQKLKGWYYGLPKYIHYPVNWVLHGLAVAAIVLVCALPGMLGLIVDPAQFIGAILGYGIGLFIYFYKELVVDGPPKGFVGYVDKVGDLLGPIAVGYYAVRFFG